MININTIASGFLEAELYHAKPWQEVLGDMSDARAEIGHSSGKFRKLLQGEPSNSGYSVKGGHQPTRAAFDAAYDALEKEKEVLLLVGGQDSFHVYGRNGGVFHESDAPDRRASARVDQPRALDTIMWLAANYLESGSQAARILKSDTGYELHVWDHA